MDELLRRFQFDHLSQPMRSISAKYYRLAAEVIAAHEGDPLLPELLTKLWEAKNLDVLMVARPSQDH